MSVVFTAMLLSLAGIPLTALTVALVWLGVYSAPLMRLIRVAVTGVG